jgi:hypothetical protein
MHPVAAGAMFVALGFVFSALHVAGIGPLRKLAYGLGGWTLHHSESSACTARGSST